MHIQEGRTKVGLRRALSAGAALLVVAFMSGCSVFQGSDSDDRAQQQAKVHTIEIAKQKIGELPQASGDVTASLQLDLITETGGRLEQISKRRGDAVSAGETIAVLRSSDLELQREQAELALKSAKDALEQAKREAAAARAEWQIGLDRLEAEVEKLTMSRNKAANDYDLGKISRQDFDQAESALTDAINAARLYRERGFSSSVSALENEVSAAEFQLKQIDQAEADMVIQADMDGVITHMPYEAGMTIPPGSVVAQLSKLDPLKIKAYLSEEALKLVQGKKELTYALPGSDAKHKGNISFLASIMDPQLKAYELHLEVPNPGLTLQPGSKVILQLMDEEEQLAVAVPRYSVVTEGDEHFVFVYVDGIAVKRKIELGRSSDALYEVLSGVQAGERLIVSGQNEITDQARVVLMGDGVQQ